MAISQSNSLKHISETLELNSAMQRIGIPTSIESLVNLSHGYKIIANPLRTKLNYRIVIDP